MVIVDKPFVTIAICTYNRAGEIVDCLKSLCQQTYKNAQILIVDDGSTDKTQSLLQRYLSAQSNFPWRLVKHDRNRGLYAARNTAVREASGEIVAFIDTDCVAYEDWLRYLISGFRDETVAMVGGYVEDFYEGRYLQLCTKGIYSQYSNATGSVKYIIGTNMAGRRSFLIENPLDEDEKYGNDDREWCEKARLSNFFVWYVPEAKVIHKHRQTLTTIVRQQYLFGRSSPIFRVKYRHFPLNLRTISFLLLLFSVAIIPFLGFSLWFLPVFFSAFVGVLVVRELRRAEKTILEILLTLPITIVSGVALSVGSLAGISFILKRR